MRMLMASVLCLVVTTFVCAAKDPYEGKKLIEYGWDCPDTAFVKEHISEMQKVPFDGIVIKLVSGKRTDNITREVGWRVFSGTRFTADDYQFGIKDLKGVKFGHFTDNFIQVIAYPGDVDFFDPEWSSVAFNAACLAKVAKQTGCKGIMFDPEHYNDKHHIWDYQSVPEEIRAKHPYNEYAAEVKARGKEFMQAINKEYPDITVLTLFGPCLSYLWTNGHPDLEKIQYGLLISFYDGMCEAATKGTSIVDGFEPSYGYTSRYPFEEGRDIVLNQTKPFSTNQKQFADHIRCGFGIWADYDSLKRGWHPEDFSKNYYSPEQLRTSLGLALQVSDKYVWVYSERLRWWDFNVPAQYVDALGQARTVK